MRAFVAILTLAAWPSCTQARDAVSLELPRGLLDTLQIKNTPVENILTCSQTLGPMKCLSSLSAWRATNAIDLLSKQRSTNFNLTEDVEKFPWKKYSNSSDEEIYSELCDGAEKLLHYRTLKLNLVPGYLFELKSKENGTLKVDVYSDEEQETARSTMKKMRKRFYAIVPLLLIPGLIMSAILPFMLPALKMSVVAVGMLNNMALTSAVFTLLRNNAFNDHYHKKIIYVNAGYRKKRPQIQFEESQILESFNNNDGWRENNGYLEEIDEVNYRPALDNHFVINDANIHTASDNHFAFNDANIHAASDNHYVIAGEDFNNVEEITKQPEWMDIYFNSNHKFVNIPGRKNKRNGVVKKKRNRYRDE